MGLVFLTLIVFTLVAMGLSRIFSGDKTEGQQATPTALEPEGEDAQQSERRLAAAMAVALALAIKSKVAPRNFRPRPNESAWKLQGREDIMRSRTTGR